MSFTVEDGTIVTGANSYVAVDYADTYHADRGNTAWASLTTGAKQVALIKATDYLEQVYEGRWVGYTQEFTQPLAWPRNYYDKCSAQYPEYYACVDTSIFGEIVPEKLKQATCELALESTTTELNPLLSQTVKREKVDVIEVEYMPGNEGGRTGTRRPAIDGLLRKLVSGSVMNAKVVRV